MKIPTATKGDDDHRGGFPLHVFPKQIEDVCHEYSKALQFHPDYIGLAMLTALSAATGAGFRAKIRNLHTEPAIIWAVLVGNPGIGKTHIINHIFKPFLKCDDDQYDLYQRELDLYEATEGKGKKPAYFQSVLRDFTYEALAESTKTNPHGCIVLSDEILSLTGNFNKFNRGSDEPYWLTLWSGHGISTTRKTQAPIHTKRSCINIVGGIQPAKLRDMLTKARFDNGFADRFLFAYPDARIEPWNDCQFDDDLLQNYFAIIRGIRNLNTGNEPTDISLDSNAWQRLKAWQWENTEYANQMNEEGSQLAGLRKKWESYVCQFALILQIADAYSETKQAPDSINENAISGAIKLFDYFLNQTQKAFDLITRPAALDHLNDKLRKIYEDLPEEFNRAEAAKIANSHGYSDRALTDFLSKPLFIKVKHGTYQKRAV